MARSILYKPVTWPIQSFAVSNDFRSPGPALLLLDRANAEFGLIYQTEPGIAVMAQFPDTEEPVYFQASKARAACTRFNNSCKKVCILMQHLQLDLTFMTGAHAADFLRRLGRIATRVGNLHFEVHEAASNAIMGRADFSMEKEGYGNCSTQAWMAIPDDNTSEWARIYKTAKCTDFKIIADGRVFPAHRVLLSTRSQYFNAVCDGRFSETAQRSITLPESAETVSTLLQEMYEVYNPTTGSIFANFALRRAIEKEQVMDNLAALFIASDKYGLEPIRNKVSFAIIDRLPFVYDPLAIVDLASTVYHEGFPAMDCDLRKAVIGLLQARLPAVMDDEEAWREYVGNQAVVKALHSHQCEMLENAQNGLLTPPVTPTKK
ncbi:hypothetical protein BDW02DRAFT_310501 [Decorospora gaudefroyi]|uniref:BTB domain-containing protein n=1 Tax=Decorospora gaudefroyi TaxID=184978 RepID=A0A6A5KHQ7_9PLEO|nr:hypothetical protein BDW02DRAFT_310501 [Decorospora gaudefroyi]